MTDPDAAEPPIESEKAWELRYAQAKWTHDFHLSFSNEMFKAVMAFAVEAIRTVALINGGSAVAAIALVGNVFGKDRSLAADLSVAVLIFGIGVLAAGAASAFSYLAQYSYHLAHNEKSLHWHQPFVREDGKTTRYHRVGVTFHVLAVISVLVGYSATCLGAWTVATTFRPDLW